MKRVLILGATSSMAGAVARLYAHQGAALYLVGRDVAKLAATESDVKVRGACRVVAVAADLVDTKGHEVIISDAAAALGGLDIALIAHGELGAQATLQASVPKTLAIIASNFLSHVSLLTVLGNHFEEQKSGTIAVITSVAGDRGRKSNYVYGAAKGGLSVFLSGLRNRLAVAGVSVIDIRPGFVDTPMTASYKKGLLWAKPDQVAKVIVAAIASGRDVVYVPWFWRWIMLVIRSIPEWKFKRMNWPS
ncbi:MAG: SDR family oxidoreductase [Deltaproteobacteria bacterium]|nr:SDR family oxidoreductase [Deltaproteobacteria bacterium]